MEKFPLSFRKLHQCVPYVIAERKIGTGRDSIVYSARLPNGKAVALKLYNEKSPERIVEESYMQYVSAAAGLSPAIYSFGTNYIVMDILEDTLLTVLKKQGTLTPEQQREILNVLTKMDGIKIFINDANPANFMYSNGRLYIIDFGYASFEKHPANAKLMPLGLMLYTKGKYNIRDWKIIRAAFPLTQLKAYGLI